jgi:hypothetical protein
MVLYIFTFTFLDNRREDKRLNRMVVKGHWALQNSIYYYVTINPLPTVLMRIYTTRHSHYNLNTRTYLLCGNNASKQKTAHSSMACHAHVLLHNAVKQMFTC